MMGYGDLDLSVRARQRRFLRQVPAVQEFAFYLGRI